MKKIIYLILLISLLIFSYFYFINKDEKSILSKLDDINEEFYIDDYKIFGTHFNISGCIDKKISNESKIVLVSMDDETDIESTFDITENKSCFYLSSKNNEGLYLDDLKRGSYLLLVKEINNQDVKYYTLNNKTNYSSLEYYTITKNNENNKININFESIKNKNYVKIDVVKSKLTDDNYDITIDPGHGGNDVGAIGILNNQKYYESDLTLEIALLLKQELEDLGLKVKLTRENDVNIDYYGDGGRAVIPNEVNSKYSLSIHLNSAQGIMSYGGVEVYTPNDVNLEFAKILAKNISNIVGYSKKPTDKLTNGVYFNYFTKSDIEESNENLKEDGMEPYDIKEGSPYMYMIREVGGVSTYAYQDGRNIEYGLNKYYNSNKTAEPYLIEMAYINYDDDLNQLINNKELFAESIKEAVKEYLNIS